MVALAAMCLSACTSDEPSAEMVCLQAVGELDASIERYEDLLDEAVAEMREPDAVEKLEDITAEYSSMLDELETRQAEVPEDVQRAYRLLVGGVGMQESAWISIKEGIEFRTPDLIDDGAELIVLSRQAVSESRLAIPNCSQAGD